MHIDFSRLGLGALAWASTVLIGVSAQAATVTLPGPYGDVSVNVPAVWTHGAPGQDITHTVTGLGGSGPGPGLGDLYFYWPTAKVDDGSLKIGFYNADQIGKPVQTPIRAQHSASGNQETFKALANGLKIDVPLTFSAGTGHGGYVVETQLRFNGDFAAPPSGVSAWIDTKITLTGTDSQGATFVLSEMERKYSGPTQESFFLWGLIQPGRDIVSVSGLFLTEYKTDAPWPSGRWPNYTSELFVEGISLTPMTTVPEAGSLSLLMLGLGALSLLRRR